MSKQMALIGATAFATVVAGGVGLATHKAGTRVSEGLTKFHAEMQKELFDGEMGVSMKGTHEKGFLSTKGTTEILSEDGKQLARIEYELGHGPLVMLSRRSPFEFSMFVPEIAAASDIGSKPVLTGKGETGEEDAEVSISGTPMKMASPKGGLTLSGYEGTARVSKKNVSISFDMPEIVLLEGASQMATINGIGLRLSSEVPQPGRVPTHEFSFDVKGVSVKGGLGSGEGLSLKSSAKSAGGKVEVANSLRIGKISALGETLSEIELSSSLKNIDEAKLIKFVTSESPEEGPTDAQKKEKVRGLIEMLGGGGELSIDKIAGTWGDSSISMEMKAGMKAGKPSVAKNIYASFKGRLTGKAVALSRDARVANRFPLFAGSPDGQKALASFEMQGGRVILNGTQLAPSDALALYRPLVLMDRKMGFETFPLPEDAAEEDVQPQAAPTPGL